MCHMWLDISEHLPYTIVRCLLQATYFWLGCAVVSQVKQNFTHRQRAEVWPYRENAHLQGGHQWGSFNGWWCEYKMQVCQLHAYTHARMHAHMHARTQHFANSYKILINKFHSIIGKIKQSNLNRIVRHYLNIKTVHYNIDTTFLLIIYFNFTYLFSCICFYTNFTKCYHSLSIQPLS